MPLITGILLILLYVNQVHLLGISTMNRLFPRPVFRRVYDQLTGLYPSKGHKIYLKILQLAKMYGELDIVAALEILLESATEATIDNITALLDNRPKTIYSVEISQPLLGEYDQLHGFKTSEAA